jgi:hypothetical protein
MIWLKICSFASDNICCTVYDVVTFKNHNLEKQVTNLVKSKVNILKLKVLFENIYDSSSSEFLSYNLMLNSGEKKFTICATKKINILTRVVRKKNSERNKKP